MLEWSIPEAEDEDWINSCIAVSGTMASDASFANIYLLRNKYSTKISRYKDFIILEKVQDVVIHFRLEKVMSQRHSPR